jgi:glycosyltransferase involved in cell wall biosynthesis
MTSGILITIPYDSETGYAISPYVKTFFRLGTMVCGGKDNVHVAYTRLRDDAPKHLLSELTNVLEFDTANPTNESLSRIGRYVKERGIKVVFGVDLPFFRPCYRTLRDAGVSKIISHYGAPMGSIKSGWKLWLKRALFRLKREHPDHFVFESRAMQDTAIYGAGIPAAMTSVVHLGVDPAKHAPINGISHYAHAQFGIPPERRIVLYSGHMEARKGVDVIVKAAADLVNVRGRTDCHFLLCGNREGEETKFDSLYKRTPAEQFITFGGYRSDLDDVQPSCYLGAIASTGWDSFPYSSIEMQACGLPMVVSRFQGLAETIINGETGLYFERGNFSDLADKLEFLLDHPDARSQMSVQARARVLKDFTLEQQVSRLVEVVQRVLKKDAKC